jgi:hypothetical protein
MSGRRSAPTLSRMGQVVFVSSSLASRRLIPHLLSCRRTAVNAGNPGAEIFERAAGIGNQTFNQMDN